MKENGFFAQFKKFITRGNVLDMAVGVIIGASFNAIVTSLVNDIISPVIGIVTGGVDFTSMVITLKAATETAEAVTINYGLFINTCITFLLTALTLFVIIKSFNKMQEMRAKKETEEKAAAPAAKAAGTIPTSGWRCASLPASGIRPGRTLPAPTCRRQGL